MTSMANPKASGSLRRVVMSLKMIPGFGKSGISLIVDLSQSDFSWDSGSVSSDACAFAAVGLVIFKVLVNGQKHVFVPRLLQGIDFTRAYQLNLVGSDR